MILIADDNKLYDHLNHIGDLVIVFGPMFWWLVRAARRLGGSVAVAKDVSEVHLPFLYTWLRRHNDELDTVVHDHMRLPDHPNIVLVPNGSK